MRISKLRALPTDTLYVPRGTINPDRRPGTLLWMRDRGHIYVTCKACNAINDITDHQIPTSGEVMIDRACFVCTNCYTHYYFKLIDHEPGELVRCDVCCTYEDKALSIVTNKGEIRRLRKVGWFVNAKDTQRSRCPYCIKAHGRPVMK